MSVADLECGRFQMFQQPFDDDPGWGSGGAPADGAGRGWLGLIVLMVAVMLAGAVAGCGLWRLIVWLVA